MKNTFLFLLLLFFTCTAYAQDSRNFRVVKAPTQNPTNQQRKAVVIGMSDYGTERSLNNTLNDANDMADVLTQLGFEVTLLKNNDLRNLKTNLNNWYAGIEENDMAVFYFAGHGLEVNGENYLIPVDAELNSQTDVEYNALNVNQVLGNMDEKRVSMKLLILDACRDNPFKRSWSRGSEEKGLAQMKAPKGTYIAFAAAPGFTAQDGGNYDLHNGVFTYYLKQEIIEEGLSIDEIFNNVTGDVSNLTHDQQTPFKNSSLTKTFYFKPKINDSSDKVSKIYFYYVDQNGNESNNRFVDRKNAESEMKSKNLYGKIYSNAGEVFVVDKSVVEQPIVDKLVVEQFDKPVVANKRTDEIYSPNDIELVYVEGSTFIMGCTSEQGNDCSKDEKPAHQVTISSFYIGKYEVTQSQWKAVMGNNPSKFKDDNLPVENVNWNDVQEFIRKLNAQTGKHYRLPTEAEWEYAACGGNKSHGYKYSGSNTVGNVAWNYENSNSTTHPVGTQSPNELGIYDMSGNVWEWCSDWYGNYPASAQTNPSGPSSGTNRVIRGGSLNNSAKSMRVSSRYYYTPKFRNYNFGFRLACSSR